MHSENATSTSNNSVILIIHTDINPMYNTNNKNVDLTVAVIIHTIHTVELPFQTGQRA